MSKRRTRTLKKARKTTSLGGGIATGLLGVAVAGGAKLASLVRRGAGSVGVWCWQSRGVRRVAGLTAGALVCAGAAWLMQSNMSEDARYQVDPGRIQLEAQPEWAKGDLAASVKHEIESELRAELAMLEMADAFTPELMEEVAAKLRQNPWVHDVVKLERRFPTSAEPNARLHAIVDIRTPALMVERADCYVLVDSAQNVLPLSVPRDALEGFCAQLTSPLRVVRGVDGTAPEPGSVWQNEQLSAALSMERVLRQSQIDQSMVIEAMELVGIPTSGDHRGRVFYQPDGGVVLIPDQGRFQGTRLMWGRPPVHSSTLEMSPNDKLNKLQEQLLHPEAMTGKHIDLRHKS